LPQCSLRILKNRPSDAQLATACLRSGRRGSFGLTSCQPPRSSIETCERRSLLVVLVVFLVQTPLSQVPSFDAITSMALGLAWRSNPSSLSCQRECQPHRQLVARRIRTLYCHVRAQNNARRILMMYNLPVEGRKYHFCRPAQVGGSGVKIVEMTGDANLCQASLNATTAYPAVPRSNPRARLPQKTTAYSFWEITRGALDFVTGSVSCYPSHSAQTSYRTLLLQLSQEPFDECSDTR
jgi:hypothetical protein